MMEFHSNFDPFDYVMKNLEEIKLCPKCQAQWFKFRTQGNFGFYRLGPVPPEECETCSSFNDELMKNAIITSESWIDENGKEIDD